MRGEGRDTFGREEHVRRGTDTFEGEGESGTREREGEGERERGIMTLYCSLEDSS